MKNRLIKLAVLAAILSPLWGRFLIPGPPAQAAGEVNAAYFTKIVTNTSTTVPTALSSTNLFVTRATILAKRSARVSNTGVVYIGTSSTDDLQPYAISVDGEVILEAAYGTKINLAAWYLDPSTVNDGVVILGQ